MVFLEIAGTIVGFYAAIKLGGVAIAWLKYGFQGLKPPKPEKKRKEVDVSDIDE